MEKAWLVVLLRFIGFLAEVAIFNGLQTVLLDHLKNLPLLELKILATSTGKISFVEFVHIRVLEIPWEVTCCVRNFVGPVSNK